MRVVAGIFVGLVTACAVVSAALAGIFRAVEQADDLDFDID